MSTLITTFSLDVEMATKYLNKVQLFLFKVRGMRIISTLKVNMKRGGNEVKDEKYGFSSMAEASREECEEGYKKIMDMLTDNKIDSELKHQLNHRDMKFFKKMFYRGVKKLSDNSFLSLLNSYGILAQIEII